MQSKTKFIAAFIVIMMVAIPGAVFAQNPDLSQNPAPDQSMTPSQDQSQYQDQDQDMGPTPSQPDSQPNSMSSPTYDQNNSNDQNDRPPMSELPPKPSPNIQGPPPGPSLSGPNGPGNYPGGQGNYNETSSNSGVARLSLIHGDVSTRHGDSGEWSAAQLNAPLMAGDSVSTGDKARTELQLDYANILRLSGSTQANITNLTRSQIQIQLGHGMANYTVLRNSDADAEIDTPNVAIRTNRREASFRILVTADDHTEVLVRRGEVEITTPQGGTRVAANQFITIRGSGDQTQYRIGEAPARDDWDQWNTDRDRLITNSVSRSRTNDYYVGTQDLDAYGSWNNVPDYGNVWFPAVAPGWAPYRTGTWVWQPYWGWTWVSYDPWGWAPYHYGRWFLYNGAWGWWPGPVYPYYRPIWAPAYVSFFGFGPGFGVGFGWGWGSIGWFPIGPCDRFYPWWGGYRGRFGTVGFNAYNRGGFAPLHGGDRFSNVNLAMHDSRFNGATSVGSNEFGRGGRTNYQPVNHASLQNAHFSTGNLPVVPSRSSLSASGRPAAADTISNRGNQSFFSTRGRTTAPNSTGAFERQQSQLSTSIRQSGFSPITGNRNGFDTANRGGNESSMRSSGSEVHNNIRMPESGFRQSGDNGNRSTSETHDNFNGSPSRPSNPVSSEAGREGTGANNGGWQKFTPMSPKSQEEFSRGSTSGNVGSENRGSTENRGSFGSSPSRGQSSESRGYGAGSYGGSSRPQLNMRQPIVTPRYGSPYGGYPGGRSMPSYGRGSTPSYGGGRTPSYGGSHSAPSFGGGHSAPSGHGGGASHGGGSHGGGSHGGGHR